MTNIYDNKLIPSPINVLHSLVDAVAKDNGRIVIEHEYRFVLRFLRSIRQPPIDVLYDNETGHKQIILTQKLKAALTALSHGDYTTLRHMEEIFMTDEYISLCSERIIIPDYYFALLCVSEVIGADYLATGAVTLTLETEFDSEAALFVFGMDNKELNGRIESVNRLTFAVTVNKNTTPESMSVPRGLLLGAEVIGKVISPNGTYRDLLNHQYGIQV